MIIIVIEVCPCQSFTWEHKNWLKIMKHLTILPLEDSWFLIVFSSPSICTAHTEGEDFFLDIISVTCHLLILFWLTSSLISHDLLSLSISLFYGRRKISSSQNSLSNQAKNLCVWAAWNISCASNKSVIHSHTLLVLFTDGDLISWVKVFFFFPQDGHYSLMMVIQSILHENELLKACG